MKTNAASVITNIDFNSLSHEALCSFLSLEKMNLDDEMKLYEAAVTWATTNTTTTNQHREAACAAPSDGEIRRTLGKALFLIRFPAADMKRFANVCGKTGVLTDKEKAEIYVHGLGDQKTEDRKSQNKNILVAGFSAVPREASLLRVNRFESTEPGWQCGQEQTLSFQTSSPIILHGISVYGTTTGGVMHNVTVNVCSQYREPIASTTKASLACDGTPTPIPITFDRPVKIEANIPYIISVTLSGTTYYGTMREQYSIDKEGIVFTFLDSEVARYQYQEYRYDNTTSASGQVPELLFRKENSA